MAAEAPEVRKFHQMYWLCLGLVGVMAVISFMDLILGGDKAGAYAAGTGVAAAATGTLYAAGKNAIQALGA